jgi:hypothetical protein
MLLALQNKKRQTGMKKLRREAAICLKQVMPLLGSSAEDETALPELHVILLRDMTGQQGEAATAQPLTPATKEAQIPLTSNCPPSSMKVLLLP